MKTIAQTKAVLGLTDYTTEVSTKNYTLICDEPVDDGGQNAGPNPYEYILAGLASCTLITLRMYAKHKGWDVGTLSADMSLQKDKEKRTHIHRIIKASESLTEEQWQGMLRIADKTPVTLTLKDGSNITTEAADS